MILNLPIQINESTNEQKFQIEIETKKITNNKNYFNVPIIISPANGQTSFKPNDNLRITIDSLDNNISIDQPRYKAGCFVTTINIPTTENNKQLNLILNLQLDNQDSEVCTISINLPKINPNSINLPISSIIGIVVSIVVVIGLIGWIIYLLNKRKNQKVIDKYHNKRKKNL